MSTPSFGEDTEQMELSYIAHGNANLYTTLEKFLAVSTKPNIHILVEPAIPLEYEHYRSECLYPPKDMDECVHSNYSNGPNLIKIQMFIVSQMNK